jgi:hypothetical protein
LPKDNVDGANLTWANADEPMRKRESKGAALPKKCFIPCFAGLELELWK